MRSLLLALLAGGLWLSPLAASAQENLPPWAAPPPSSTDRAGEVDVLFGPLPPNDPSLVPVNGLLALLAMFGAAYTVRRLTGRADCHSSSGT